MTILVLAKNKTDTNIQFINATGEKFFKKATNTNEMTDDHIKAIMDMFDSKEKTDYVAETLPQQDIIDNEYNLSVSSYVKSKDPREVINVDELNKNIKTTVDKIDQLRTDIDAIIADINA